MKFFLSLLVIAAPHFALAQTATTISTTPPLTITTTTAGKTTTTVVPSVDALLEQITDSYTATRTFNGTFDLFIKDEQQKDAAPLKIHLKVLSRSNAGKALEKDATLLKLIGQFEGDNEKFQILDNGHIAQLVLTLPKDKTIKKTDVASRVGMVFLKTGEALSALEDSKEPPTLSITIENERPLLVLSFKNNAFRIILDAQTHAVRSLDLSEGVLVRVLEQTFNAPISNIEFQRTPLVDNAKGEVVAALPSLMDNSDNETADAA